MLPWRWGGLAEQWAVCPPGLFVHDSGNACKAIGFLYQFEETCTLILILRIAMHPFKFMVQKEDMNA